MLPTVTWTSPRSLTELARRSGRPLRNVRRYLDAYLNVACRPVLATPRRRIDDLASIVQRYAMVSWEERLRLLFALLESLGPDAELLPESVETGANSSSFAGGSANLLSETAADSFRMGARIYARAAQRVLRHAIAHPAATIPVEQTPSWYEWLHVAGCLDVAATSTVLFLEEDRRRSRAPVAEELCFLVKEFALAYGALVEVFLPRAPRGRGRPRMVRLTGTDRAWDRQFCALTMPQLAAETRD